MTCLFLTYPNRQRGVRRVLSAVLLVGAASLSACQTVPSDPLLAGNHGEASGGQDNGHSSDDVARIRTAMAAQYIKQQDLDSATRQLQRAFKANSNYAPAYDMMGVLLQQEGSRLNLDKADWYFRRAIELDPDFIQAHNNYGVYLARMQQVKPAIAQFEIAGNALGYAGRAGALENLGSMRLKVGNTAGAMQAFQRAIQANPNRLPARIALIDLLLDQQQVDQAEHRYNQTIALLQGQVIGPRLLLQGIRLAKARGNSDYQQQLTAQLFADYPLSKAAKQLKRWLSRSNAVW